MAGIPTIIRKTSSHIRLHALVVVVVIIVVVIVIIVVVIIVIVVVVTMGKRSNRKIVTT